MIDLEKGALDLRIDGFESVDVRPELGRVYSPVRADRQRSATDRTLPQGDSTGRWAGSLFRGKRASDVRSASSSRCRLRISALSSCRNFKNGQTEVSANHSFAERHRSCRGRRDWSEAFHRCGSSIASLCGQWGIDFKLNIAAALAGWCDLCAAQWISVAAKWASVACVCPHPLRSSPQSDATGRCLCGMNLKDRVTRSDSVFFGWTGSISETGEAIFGHL
jgi:hypothetical protein